MLHSYQWIKPGKIVVFLAILLFIFLMLLQTSSFIESRPIAENSFTTILTWPDLAYKKVKRNYIEIRLPYNEQVYLRLSQQTDQRVTHELAANGPDYIMVYKKGGIYGMLRAILFLGSAILYILNFYILALILYWLGRGIKKIVRSS